MVTSSDRTLFHLLGLRVSADRSALLGLTLLWIGLTLVALIGFSFPLTLAMGMALAAVLLHVVSELWHQYGHALAARQLGYPMIGIRLWWVLSTSLYPANEPPLPASVHIRRALGGPIASALLSLIGGVVLLMVRDSWPVTWVAGLFFAENLLLFTAQVLLPLGFNDGATIWRWMRERRS